jgi:hypothetical protein
VTTSHKVALSFLISVLLFVAFTALAFTGLFNLLEARFYNPSIIASITRDNEQNAQTTDRFLAEMQERFQETLNTRAVRRSFLPNQDPAYILEREQIYQRLIESFDGIQWVRFIDSGGIRIHFSSYAPDIHQYDAQTLTYHNYNEPDLPYRIIAAGAGERPKLTFDDRAARILFSFPLYDFFESYWGTALFSLSISALSDRLISEGRIRFGHDISVISNPAGLLFGISAAAGSVLPSQVSTAWMEDGNKTLRLRSPALDHSIVLISTKTSQGIFVGRIANEELFSLPQPMKIILLVSFFITAFLIIFLIFNFRQDPVTVIQNRLKQLQISLIEQFYELKGEADWALWVQELDLRRNEIFVEVKQGVSTASGDESRNIDLLINKSWDELLAVLGGRKEGGIDEEKLQALIKNIFADHAKTLITQSAAVLNVSKASSPPADAGVPVSAGGKRGLLMRATAIVKELEETEEVEMLEEEDIAAEETPSTPAGPKTMVSREDIQYLASEIEFSEAPEPHSSEDEILEEDLEIVSPFSTMLFDFSAGDDKNQDTHSFQMPDGSGGKKAPGPTQKRKFQELESLPSIDDADDDESLISAKEIIEEFEGVPHISEEALSPDPEAGATLNRDFKNLVDSVVSPKT